MSYAHHHIKFDSCYPTYQATSLLEMDNCGARRILRVQLEWHLPAIIVTALVAALVVGIVHAISEALDITDAFANIFSNVLWKVFDLVDRSVPPILDILRQVLDVLDLQRKVSS